MDNLFGLISKVNIKMNEYIIKRMNEEGYKDLHVSHGSILINFMNEDKLNYKELSRRINKSPQTMTTLVRKLKDEGYVVIEKDVTDKRNKYVAITEKGKKFIPLMKQISTELYDLQYKGFSDHERSIIRELLTNMSSNFEGAENESK